MEPVSGYQTKLDVFDVGDTPMVLFYIKVALRSVMQGIRAQNALAILEGVSGVKNLR
jgi:hypothetical protein